MEFVAKLFKFFKDLLGKFLGNNYSQTLTINNSSLC
ncbi:TPA: alpha-3 family phenol-soluble modulin [Staphylococcus aureus]|nr:alpha-3 family phenol-soluble modulin [Staphylococcus aureus]HDN3443552.1 alpha-3 family phenol-soluble modulin [Staphylococcus aureus]HEK6545289.1 alpha-3 family phenol-soluble modulin [Staphylococcus aureus]